MGFHLPGNFREGVLSPQAKELARGGCSQASPAEGMPKPWHWVICVLRMSIPAREMNVGKLERERGRTGLPGQGGCLDLGLELKERCLELEDASVSHQHRAVN